MIQLSYWPIACALKPYLRSGTSMLEVTDSQHWLHIPRTLALHIHATGGHANMHALRRFALMAKVGGRQNLLGWAGAGSTAGVVRRGTMEGGRGEGAGRAVGRLTGKDRSSSR